MKYTILFLISIFTLSCQSQTNEIIDIEKSLTKDFKNFNVEAKKIEIADNKILKIYFDENSMNVQNFLRLREAAINICDRITLSKDLELIVFKFPTSSSEYYDISFETKLLSQEHTENLQFKNPVHSFEEDDFQKTLDKIGKSAGRGTADGGSVYYYPEAGFSIYKGNTITYHARGSKGCNQYMKELPYGIDFDMSKEKLVELFGQPENDSNVNWEFKDKEISILFIDNKIYWVEQLEKEFAKSLREKYPLKKK